MTAPVAMASRGGGLPGSDDRQWGDPRAGCPAQFGVGNDEQELVHPGAGDLAEAEVLHDDDPVADVEGLGHHERFVRVFWRVRAEAPGVAPGQRHPMLSEPPGQVDARAWL